MNLDANGMSARWPSGVRPTGVQHGPEGRHCDSVAVFPPQYVSEGDQALIGELYLPLERPMPLKLASRVKSLLGKSEANAEPNDHLQG